MLDVMTNVGSIDDLTDGARIFLVLPVAVLDAVFIMWTFTSLSKTLTQLQARRQLPKLHLYRNFTNLLAVAVLISVVWIGFEMYFKVTDSFNEAWQSDWVTGAFWHVLNLTIMIGICFLWRPTDTSVQYGWVEVRDGRFAVIGQERSILTGPAALRGAKQNRAIAHQPLFVPCRVSKWMIGMKMWAVDWRRGAGRRARAAFFKRRTGQRRDHIGCIWWNPHCILLLRLGMRCSCCQCL